MRATVANIQDYVEKHKRFKISNMHRSSGLRRRSFNIAMNVCFGLGLCRKDTPSYIQWNDFDGLYYRTLWIHHVCWDCLCDPIKNTMERLTVAILYLLEREFTHNCYWKVSKLIQKLHKWNCKFDSRRVYDVVNVMTELGVLDKDGKYYRYISAVKK